MDDALSFIMDAQELGLLPVLARPANTEPPKVKGHCRYCGKPVKQGVFLHEKFCTARPK